MLQLMLKVFTMPQYADHMSEPQEMINISGLIKQRSLLKLQMMLVQSIEQICIYEYLKMLVMQMCT